MKKTHYMTLVIGITLLLTGCVHTKSSVKDTQAPNPSKTLAPVQDGMQDVSKGLEGSSKRIKTSAEDVRKGAEGAREGAEAGDVEKVRQEAQNLRKTADELDQEAIELQNSRNKVDALLLEVKNAGNQGSELKTLYERAQKEVKTSSEDHEKEVEALTATITELSSERDAALQQALLYLIIGSIILTAVSIAMCVNGSTGMSVCAVVGIITLVIANTMRAHNKIFATAGGIGIAITLGLIGYKVWRHRRAEKALEETVHSMEAVKQVLPETEKAQLFGSGAHTGMLHNIQSEGTMEMVNEKRLRLKPKLEHTLS